MFVARCVFALAAAALMGAVVPAARAQTFPTKPVRIVVPFTAGSQTDLIARVISPRLTELWGQQMIIDNRGGAGGTLGTGIVADSTPDGYTLLLHSSGYSVAPAIYPKWKVNMLRDFQPITTLVSTPHVVIVSPNLGPKTLKELIELARKKGDGFTWGSAGTGSGTHFCGEIFMQAANLTHTHVPSKGTPEALIDTITGRVNVFFAPLGAAVPFLRDGKALGLAVTSKKRNPAVPNIPTVDEAGLAGFQVDFWFLLAAPAKVPKPVIEKIWTDVGKVLNMPEVIKAFAVTGVVPDVRTIAETERFVTAELKTYADVVRLAKIPTL